MKIITSFIVVVIAGYVLWCQFDTKTDDVRSLNLQVTGYNIAAVRGVTLERVNDADLQVNIRLGNYFKAFILLDKAVDQVPSCASVENIEDGETFKITLLPSCTGNEIEFIARDAVTLTDEGYRVYVDARSSEVPLERFVLLYESHELLNFAIPTVDTLGADERTFSNLENANGRFVLRWQKTKEIMAAFTDTMQQKKRQAYIVGSSALLGAGLGTLLSGFPALFRRRRDT